jgi:glyoxylase-like metal-dependent hydrolase (beta-lactamase superfamily II)
LDHVFGNVFITSKYGVLPFAHQADEVLLENFDQQLSFFGLNAVDGVQALGGYLTEDDVLTIGDEQLSILHIPGHSLGSLCFYSQKSNVVFVGDVLFQESIGRTDLQGGNYAQLIEGITKKLFSLPDETIVYSGHGSVTQIGYEKQNNPYL